MVISFFDVDTATALSQILPVLLLAVMVELRRTEIHRRGRIRITRGILLAFFAAFAVIETILVLSIDGRLYPFRWSDLAAALVIFALLWLLFLLSMVPSGRGTSKKHDPRSRHDDDDDESDDDPL